MNINIPVSGCIDLSSFDSIAVSSSGWIRHASFTDTLAGCEPTIATAHTLDTRVLTDSGYLWTIDRASLPTCGRMQFDWQDGLASPVQAIVINTGVDCGFVVPHDPIVPQNAVTPEPSYLLLMSLLFLLFVSRKGHNESPHKR